MPRRNPQVHGLAEFPTLDLRRQAIEANTLWSKAILLEMRARDVFDRSD